MAWLCETRMCGYHALAGRKGRSDYVTATWKWIHSRGIVQVIQLMFVLPGKAEWKTKKREDMAEEDEASLSCVHLHKEIANYWSWENDVYSTFKVQNSQTSVGRRGLISLFLIFGIVLSTLPLFQNWEKQRVTYLLWQK